MNPESQKCYSVGFFLATLFAKNNNTHINPFLIGFLLLSSISHVFGQAPNHRNVSIGPEIGVPFDSGNVYSLGLGVSGKITYPINSEGKFLVSSSLGYYTFIKSKEDNELEKGRLGVLPITLGLQYNVFNPFYINVEPGVAVGVSGGMGKRFALISGGGILINNKLDLGLRYHLWNGSGLLGLRVAYKWSY